MRSIMHDEMGKMRLTCPNCDAQYEVPDEVIPTSGRDVQCSNCGQTWFQHHPDHAPEEEDEPLAVDTGTDDPDEEVTEAPPPPTNAPPSPQRRKLDPAVADILRQEAEAEFEARKRAQSAPIETQPDLGLDEADNAPRETEDDAEHRKLEARRRMARMRGEPDPVQVTAAAGPRRELLPDIEEINSTLRNDNGRNRNAAEIRGAVEAERMPQGGRGFRSGFLIALAVLAIMIAIYVGAPRIAQIVPQSDPYLSAYVGWVDMMRFWFDGQIKTLLTWLDTVASETEN